MQFTFLEYNLVIFIGSFIIFTLGIKNDVIIKYLKFKKYFDEQIEKALEDKSRKDDIKKQIDDTLKFHLRVFEKSLKLVTGYIYHTFYVIFTLSSIGVFIGLIIEFNVDKLKNLAPFVFGNLFLFTLSSILLYFTARGIFLLICYTKIDSYEYIGKLTNKIRNTLDLNFKEILGNKYSNMGRVKINALSVLFFIFLIDDNTFKQFFYIFYEI